MNNQNSGTWRAGMGRFIRRQESSIIIMLILYMCFVSMINPTFISGQYAAKGLEQELKKAVPGKEPQTDTVMLKADDPGQLGICLLSHIRRLFFSVYDTRDQNKNYFVDRAVMYIKANYQKEISLGSIAQEIRVSPYYLSKLFRKYTGKTCTEIIAEERIEAAKRLLSQNYSSKETCFQVGFNSQNYFLKIFKKYVGVTPGEYRNAGVSAAAK
jgi:two-component system response regulator YesN